MIKSVLDAGADGIIVPMVKTESDAQRAVSFSKCSPEGAEVTILERPEFLLGDMVSIQPLIAYYLSQTSGEYYLQTHSTNPLVAADTIERSVKALFAQDGHDALFTVTPTYTRFYWPDGRGVNHDPGHLIRTQDLEPIYEENSCLYIFSKETNLKTKNRLGEKPMMFSMDRLEAVDIDDVEDFYWAEHLLLKQHKHDEK